jgi:phytoene dehydrogenase-like protein
MKAAVIGSGIGGLVSAAYLAKAGHDVTVYEQWPHPGGVTATLEQDGFRWDLGPLLIAGLAPSEPVGQVLSELGVADRVRLIRGDRTYVFPDFALQKPDVYGGPFWRRDLLKQIFPEESDSLDRYFRFHTRMTEIMDLSARAERSSTVGGAVMKLRLFSKLLPIWTKRSWSAQRLMAHFFRSERLQAVFASILADFVVRPDEFPGLAIPAVNPEAVYDERLPLDAPGAGLSHHYIAGGCDRLVEALVKRVEELGGRVRTSSTVRAINVENGRVRGVVVDAEDRADLVFVSGGARETFLRLVGEEHLTREFVATLEAIPLMESVLMVHLGIDFDPTPYQKEPLFYYYGTYDIEHGVEECRAGRYHEGRDGFLIYVPSLHSPEMAPPGCHAVTIYTIAPNRLDEGSWAERGEELAERLVGEAEKIIPGLCEGARVRVVMTPEGFKARTFLSHHSFGGVAPVLGRPGIPHRTPLRGLWFVGSQSESGAGVGNVVQGAWRAVRAATREASASGGVP